MTGWKGTPRFHVEIVDREHGSALAAWQAMGSPAFPTRQQYERLSHAAAATKKLDTATFSLAPQSWLWWRFSEAL